MGARLILEQAICRHVGDYLTILTCSHVYDGQLEVVGPFGSKSQLAALYDVIWNWSVLFGGLNNLHNPLVQFPSKVFLH